MKYCSYWKDTSVQRARRTKVHDSLCTKYDVTIRGSDVNRKRVVVSTSKEKVAGMPHRRTSSKFQQFVAVDRNPLEFVEERKRCLVKQKVQADSRVIRVSEKIWHTPIA